MFDSLTRRHPLPLLLLALTLLAAAVYLPLLGHLPLYWEEPRRALVAAEMLAGGDYLVPVHAGEIYLGKPPLFNWLILAASLPAGQVGEVSARLPSVLAAWLLTLFLVASNFRRLGAEASLFFGGALLLAPEVLLKGQLAEIDLVFAGLVSGSLWTWFLLDQRGWRGLSLWVPPLLLTALGFLTKREPALVFFYLGVGSYLLTQGRWRELFSPGHLLAALLAALPVAAWLTTLAYRVGWDSLWHSLVQEVLLRGQRDGLGRYLTHLLTYPLQLLAAGLPFFALLPPLVSGAWRRALLERYGDAARFAALVVLVNLPLYWFKGDLAVRYFLPMFPFLALLAAMSYANLMAGTPSGPWPRFYGGLARLLLGATLPLALALVASPWLTQRWFGGAPAWPWPWSLSLALIAAGLAGWLWQGRRQRPLTLLLPAALLTVLLARSLHFNLYIPYKSQSLEHKQNAPAIAAQVMAQTTPERPLYVSRWIPSAVWFYAPRGRLVLTPDGAALREGDLLLRHAKVSGLPGLAPGLTLQPLAPYRYEDDELILQRVRGP